MQRPQFRNDPIGCVSGQYRTRPFGQVLKKLALVSEPAAATDKSDDSVLIAKRVSKELATEIDDYRWSNRIEGRAATVILLVMRALHPETVAK
jgi:hypothetical protein